MNWKTKQALEWLDEADGNLEFLRNKILHSKLVLDCYEKVNEAQSLVTAARRYLRGDGDD